MAAGEECPAGSVDMEQVAGTCDILFICLDALRYDVAFAQQEQGMTPVLNRYGRWRRCTAPGNFTYPSHHAMFAGFLPVEEGVGEMSEREKLFFSQDIGMGRKKPAGAFGFGEATWIQALQKIGYETICIGGVHFFDKRTALGSVLPGIFQKSYWKQEFGPQMPESAGAQVDFAADRLGKLPKEQKVMMYINISALHYPTYFYLCRDNEEKPPGSVPLLKKRDSVQSQAAALRYVDGELERLFGAFSCRRKTFVICCADHGTCFGEDGCWYHGIDHALVRTVPYKHFFLDEGAAAGPMGK